jgi:adenylate kinase family enzyme
MTLGPRVVVGGVSGSGKTTLARELARRLGAPQVELDALFHKAGWEPSTDEEFAAKIRAALDAAGDTWVVDGNYSRTRPITWSRATTLVFLDYPRGVATWRATRRTVGRLIARTELWNGNRERLRNVFDKGHPIWWSWNQHPINRAGYEAGIADPAYAHLDVVRLTSPRETERWLREDAWP